VATKTADAAPAPKGGSKKLLIIILAVVLLLVLAGGGAWFYISSQRAAAAAGLDEEESAAPAARKAAAPARHAEPGKPPVYLPLDNMVVNLADPGGEKVAQVGVVFEVADAKTLESVKQFMPTIRSGVLMVLSQRTSEELLKIEGKEKLAAAILREADKPFGGGDPDETEKMRARAGYPVNRVLFSSFIVQ
jgi:flagellar FliL protein